MATSTRHSARAAAPLAARCLRPTLALWRRWAVGLVVLVCAVAVRAQQDPAFLHYWDLAPQYNPAAVGRLEQLAINAAYQTHASGFEDAGGTMYAGADMAFLFGKTRHGLGVLFQRDQFGLFSHQRFSLQYAYHFKLFGGQLSVGAEADLLNEKVDGSKAEFAESNDPVFPTSEVSGSKFDASVGLWYAHRAWYVGLSWLHLTAPTILLGERNEESVNSLYNFTAGYNIRTHNPLFTIAPSVMARFDGSSFRADITARLIYANGKKRMYGGVNYSPQNSVALFVGGMFHGIDIGYSYEAFTSGIGLQNGQHEVTLRYLLDLNLGKRGKNAHRSVRWL
jgi:type IX secretion system PorP/SprF family membrane protein